MATTRETMTGRMKPITNSEDARAATRLGFLLAMGFTMMAVAGHLAFIFGTQLLDIYARL